MRIVLKAVAATFLLFMAVTLKAQKTFSEGSIVYRAILNNPDGSRKDGTYTITVKNKQVRKELKIGSDFGNVTIFDNGQKAYILRTVNDTKLAVEMSMQDFVKKNEKYYLPVIKDVNETKQIAGLEAGKAIVSYKDGTSSTIFYTRAWKPEIDFTFERFHGIGGMPLAFDYKNDQGAVISFEAVSLDENVVESSNFKVPAGYKIISNEEYQKLKSK